ncbi:MAG: NUDIX domain-containing protein [Clostridiales bacterium]|nr:NUDIX domain-containing protein [Clostridiales bacterium]
MLGKYVRVRITKPVRSRNEQYGYEYELNYGLIESGRQFGKNVCGAYVMGVDRPVRNFDGRVIAVIKRKDSSDVYLVVAPKSTRFIESQIRDAVAFSQPDDDYTLDCLYERSCGAVVYRIINGEVRYLLIKNKRSAHWGFPKGHMERSETPEQTAKREVLEETGVHIEIIPDFSLKSEYTIQGKVEKSVIIFMAKTSDVQTKIQKEEIDDYIWQCYDKAVEMLKFDNDRAILKSGNQFLIDKGII